MPSAVAMAASSVRTTKLPVASQDNDPATGICAMAGRSALVGPRPYSQLDFESSIVSSGESGQRARQRLRYELAVSAVAANRAFACAFEFLSREKGIFVAVGERLWRVSDPVDRVCSFRCVERTFA